ncbi:hypothetical protein BCV72DRAFT_332249 [Rhizopus microsporus var. microsporus]|uniref:Uncharacterized protein n=1 Tax=Rhizopus microsporus var. microsporus TaxID=86635 RepID=A0A1X0RHL2_RHIZD|nr:hypothetical protein BCV72DRAFT_332249 [Rhizopus microsporus var. microsporus]
MAVTGCRGPVRSIGKSNSSDESDDENEANQKDDKRIDNLSTMEEVVAVIPIVYSDRSFRDIALILRSNNRNDGLDQGHNFGQHFQPISQAELNGMKPLSVAFLLSSQRTMLPVMLMYQKEMKQKKLIQEMKPQGKASSSYVYRKLQELPFVKKLSTSKYRSLKTS